MISGRTSQLKLMDAGLAFAHRMRAELQSTPADTARFTLPLWIDTDGNVRVALPVEEPEHGADALQLIVPLDELMTSVGNALHEARYRARLAEAAKEADGAS